MDESQQKMIQHLESLSLAEARSLIASHHYGRVGSTNQVLCESWLKTKEATVSEKSESESLRIARDALVASKRSNRIAVAAIIISTLVALLSVFFGD